MQIGAFLFIALTEKLLTPSLGLWWRLFAVELGAEGIKTAT